MPKRYTKEFRRTVVIDLMMAIDTLRLCGVSSAPTVAVRHAVTSFRPRHTNAEVHARRLTAMMTPLPKVQFCANEIGILDETLAHNGRARPAALHHRDG